MKYYNNLDFNITCIDTRHMRDNFVASYLIESNNEFAFVDTGAYLSVPSLLKTLKEKSISVNDLKYIFVTHAHLDHAGGTGELIRHLPNAKIVAHKNCAKHLIDPSKLKEGAIKVYGEVFFKQYLGDIIPVSKDRIIIADNQTITIGDRGLQLITTFGHAYHHYVIFDKLSNGVFSGDALGVSYSELNQDLSDNEILIFPPTTPTGFDPQEWLKTIDKINDLGIDKFYPTHYNQMPWNDKIAKQLKQRIVDFCQIAKKHQNSKNRTKDIKDGLFEYFSKTISLDTKIKNKVLNSDIILCAKGLDYWLK